MQEDDPYTACKFRELFMSLSRANGNIVARIGNHPESEVGTPTRLRLSSVMEGEKSRFES
jgi:hypothetical protein